MEDPIQEHRNEWFAYIVLGIAAGITIIFLVGTPSSVLGWIVLAVVLYLLNLGILKAANLNKSTSELAGILGQYFLAAPVALLLLFVIVYGAPIAIVAWLIWKLIKLFRLNVLFGHLHWLKRH